MRKAIWFLLILSLFSGPAQAASPWTQYNSYGEKISKKLEFGLKNVLGGWTEIYNRPVNAYKAKQNVASATAQGLGLGVMDTVGGLLHVVTFPIPVDIPLPGNGVLPNQDVLEEEAEEKLSESGAVQPPA